MRQLALIATNRIDELKKALGKRSYYAVTQLCHNHQCINPEHIIVESKSTNCKRKACKGKAVVVRDGVTDHPCPHGSVEKMRQCILPVEHGQDAVANSEEPDASTEQSPAPGLEDKATENIDAVADKFDEITPIMAQQLINKYRAITTDLGCWESEKKPDMRYGHTYVHLRKLGVRPMLHQLAVIATNRGDELKTTLGVSGRTGFHVSHLCHNGKL
ncbi:zinc-binding loop region of homing endonuclease-domain-containing protein [Lipomyces starkeyi]